MKIEIGLKINDENYGYEKFYSLHEVEDGVERLLNLIVDEFYKEKE